MTNDPQSTNWYFMAWRGPHLWIGLAKREPFVNGNPIEELGEVWFEFGDSEKEAIERVREAIEHA